MSEQCTTIYAVCGSKEELEKLRAFLFALRDEKEETMRTAVFPEEDDQKNCDVIPGLIQWWGETFGIEKAPAAAEGAYALCLTLATKNSPDHDYMDSAVMTAVGHRLKYYYLSECLGCCDYRTNDEESLFFCDKVAWDCMGHQESFHTVQDAIEYAEKMFGRKFSSIDEVNEFSGRRRDWESVYEGEEYDEDDDDGDGYDALFEYALEETYNDEILFEKAEEKDPDGG